MAYYRYHFCCCCDRVKKKWFLSLKWKWRDIRTKAKHFTLSFDYNFLSRLTTLFLMIPSLSIGWYFFNETRKIPHFILPCASTLKKQTNESIFSFFICPVFRLSISPTPCIYLHSRLLIWGSISCHFAMNCHSHNWTKRNCHHLNMLNILDYWQLHLIHLIWCRTPKMEIKNWTKEIEK